MEHIRKAAKKRRIKFYAKILAFKVLGLGLLGVLVMKSSLPTKKIINPQLHRVRPLVNQEGFGSPLSERMPWYNTSASYDLGTGTKGQIKS